LISSSVVSLFFFSVPSPTAIYTLSLHDALPIYGDDLIVVAAVGYRADDFIGLRVPLGEGLAGWVAREAQSQLVINPDDDPRFYKAVDEQTGLSTRSLIAVPLIHADEVIGVIEVVNKLNNGVFDADDVRLLESKVGRAAGRE